MEQCMSAPSNQEHESHGSVGLDNGRRRIVQLAALGAGASLLSTMPVARQASAAGTTDVLLLSCMDFRLMDEIERYMNGRQLRDKYDHVILAGASLGAVTDKYPAWNKTFWQHLEIAIQLHRIHSVMVMDHRDCGAYRVILGPEHTENATTEKRAHCTQLKSLGSRIAERYPALKVELLLMALDGSVEQIT
jgi:carbonic anhydrase